MQEPHDWTTLRDWLVWRIDLFLIAYLNEGPWEEYRHALTQWSLSQRQFRMFDETARKVVLYVTDTLNEPCYDAEVGFLTRSKESLAKSQSAVDAVVALDMAYREAFG
jgi:hypothetical protein